jgi:hypothetical protein
MIGAEGLVDMLQCKEEQQSCTFTHFKPKTQQRVHMEGDIGKVLIFSTIK